jgi:hypothetical protein
MISPILQWELKKNIMADLLNVLNNYTKESHIENLYSEISKIDFRMEPLYSTNWTNATWLTNNEVPYVALTNLMDSYYCLQERPDMAFTHIWKSINNSYLKLGKKDIIATNSAKKLNDSDGITYLVNSIESVKNQNITPTLTIIELINQYIEIIPLKSLKFVTNFILKGYAIEQAGLNKVLNSSSHNSFRTNHPVIYNSIVSTYGESYKRITNPTIKKFKAELNILDQQKSKYIPNSLSLKLQELMISRTAIINDSAGANPQTLSLTNDVEFLDVIIRIILYSVRNNSVHGNLVSRLNSEFVNADSLKNSIYIYFLAHLILSLGLYVNGEVLLAELEVNIRNLNTLKNLLAD